MRIILFLFILYSTTYSLSGQVFNWSLGAGGNFDNKINAIQVDHLNNSIVGGYFSCITDFNPAIATANLTEVGAVYSCYRHDAFFAKYDEYGNYIWVKQIGGPAYFDEINDLKIDLAGNIYVTGLFEDSVDFDPSASANWLESVGGKDIFVAKYDSTGDLIWAHTFGSSLDDEGINLTLGNNGVYITGNFRNSINFSTTPTPYIINSNGNIDIYFAKFSTSGNLLFAKNVGGSDVDKVCDIAIDSSNNIYIGGEFRGPCDFDVSASVYILNTDGSGDCFFAKYDSLSNFIMAKQFVGSFGGSDRVNSIAFDSLENIYVTGEFRGMVDFDPGPALHNISVFGQSDIFLAKFSNSGNYIWAKQIGGTTSEEGIDLYVQDNDIYITGTFSGTCDFDPAPGIESISSYGGGDDVFIGLYDLHGNLKVISRIGGAGNDLSTSILPLADATFLIGGKTGSSSVDFDTGPGSSYVSANDFYLAKFEKDPCVDFVTFIDSVRNIYCDSPIGFCSAFAYGGLIPYLFSWDSLPFSPDTFSSIAASGIHTLTITDANSCTDQKTFYVSGPDTTSLYELEAFLLTNSTFRPGFNFDMCITGLNNACLPVNGQLMLIVDSLIAIDSAFSPPDFIFGDTLIWNFANLTYDSLPLSSILYGTTSVFAELDDSIKLTVIITPVSGDNDSTNNTSIYYFPVLASYDPNDKQVYPQGISVNHGILNNQTMTYSVRFQNTGTANAINIYITDTLDPNLDLSSLNIISSSHYMLTEILPGNVLKFRFDNIYLPDSTSDEPNSHGYLIYEIDQLPGLDHGTVIENTAYIYFDYNEPVITNTVFNTIDLGLTISVSNNNFCQGDSSILTVVPNITGLQGNWKWYENICSGTVIGSGTSITVAPTSTTTYYVKDSGTVNCYSTIITVLSPTFSTQNVNTCSGDTLHFGSQELLVPGTYVETFSGSNNCDSVVTLTLIHLNNSGIANVSICNSDTLEFGAQQLFTPGIYTETFPNIAGCDSVVTLTLSYYSIDTGSTSTSICTGDSLTFGTQQLFTPGTYTEHFTSMTGCDSVANLTLSFFPVDNSVSTAGITLTANASPATYQWLDCNAAFAPLSGETNQTFTATVNGNYAVIITENGCSDTSACYLINSVAINSVIGDNLISVYPNPVSDQLNVLFGEKVNNVTIQLTSVTGEIVYSTRVLNTSLAIIPTSQLAKGCYLLLIEGSDLKTHWKIIKN